ncbi:hypothetical protein LMH87_006302 [Akanthomyces muscarius]|uniref:Uncharacterized protein n=1 Tax=Akanthomyces muscarius TaxID=2231603 RepID=A0A9W8QN33_AKAMU|nr:hypothetical protein LMH87_006302 [Akanthomyces muscarius]KAJ4164639.1 hypothetical protein LMH87_006302 [Akanthomyces muscarius]
MVTAKEERDLREAVAASLKANENRPSFQNKPDSHHRLDTEPIARNEDCTAAILDPSRLPPFQQAQTIGSADFQQRHVVERFKMHFAEVELNEGDTLVFVDFPEPSKGKPPPVDCDGVPFRSQKLRVHSEKLLATGSSRLADMFQPTYQFRVVRRRKLVNQLPEGIKYVLDLTPPSEGEEMVFQITELSLTPGIIKWWSSYARLEVPFFLVKGHDDVCPCKDLADRCMTAAMIEPISAKEKHMPGNGKSFVAMLPLSVSELTSARNHGKELQIQDIPAHFDIQDYCPIRHRNGIIRLLMLIEGKTVFMDSAPRLWTLVGLAKIWDCVSAVQDPAIQWLLQGKNSKFIEVLPEEAIRIGGIIESPQITRTAFRILVNELAFEKTATDKMKEQVDFSHVTLFGRRKGDPGDEFSNLIQHAALAFVERMTSRLAELHSPDVLEAWKIPEYMKLLKIEEALVAENSDSCKDALALISRLKSQLRLVLAHDINLLNRRLFLTQSIDRKEIDSDRATYVEPKDFQEFPDIWTAMTPVQKLMTQYPYKQFEAAWRRWVDLNQRENGSHSCTAEVTQALGNEMGKLYKLYMNHHPWTGDINPDLYNILSENWLQPQDCLYPLTQDRLDFDVRSKLVELSVKMLDSEQDLPTINTKHLLLSLTTNETKFLPLWAGGCNDGTGGVFEDQLPPAYMGPNGPGPAYHTGITITSNASSLSGSFVDDMSGMNMAGSATAASVDVNDSISTIYRPDQVITDDKSIASESFYSDFADYHEARDDVAAPRQQKREVVPQSLDEFLQATDSDSDSTATMGCDDYDTLDDDDLYMSSQPDSVAEQEGTDAEMVAA